MRARLLLAALPVLPLPAPALDEETAGRFARLVLACLHREYPGKIAHVLHSDADAAPPRLLTPAFFGCYDWHSAVHGHWLLVRLLRMFPEAEFAAEARAALARSLTRANILHEVEYLAAPGRGTFERPYGLAWLLQLAVELRALPEVAAGSWSAALEPLEELACQRLWEWLPRLSHPMRTGEHSQTAFALGLMLDWARARGDAGRAAAVAERARDYYLADAGATLRFEPGGEDFLSPVLAEADLMRRVLEPAEYAAWLERFLPELGGAGAQRWLPVAVVTDPADGKLAHLDGLNLSRAWMLEGIHAGLPADDPRRPLLVSAAARHRAAGLAAVTGEHYEGGHWLGSFAVYLVSQRGLDPHG